MFDTSHLLPAGNLRQSCRLVGAGCSKEPAVGAERKGGDALVMLYPDQLPVASDVNYSCGVVPARCRQKPTVWTKQNFCDLSGVLERGPLFTTRGIDQLYCFVLIFCGQQAAIGTKGCGQG